MAREIGSQVWVAAQCFGTQANAVSRECSSPGAKEERPETPTPPPFPIKAIPSSSWVSKRLPKGRSTFNVQTFNVQHRPPCQCVVARTSCRTAPLPLVAREHFKSRACAARGAYTRRGTHGAPRRDNHKNSWVGQVSPVLVARCAWSLRGVLHLSVRKRSPSLNNHARARINPLAQRRRRRRRR